ncbi:MAG: copper-binding protein [Candidatus Methylomirabilales bacterium]
MRKLIVLPLAALTILFFASSSFAQAAPGEKLAPAEFAKLAKAETPKAAKPKSLIGEVVSVDQQAKTVTVKKAGRKLKELTFAVEEKAAPMLADLKPGDRVRVTYVKAEGKLTAKAIVRTPRKAGKQAS